MDTSTCPSLSRISSIAVGLSARSGVSAEVLGDVEPVLAQVRYSDGRGSSGAGREQARETHGPGAHHQHAAAGPDAAAPAGVDADRQGLQRRSGVERDVIGQFVAEVRGVCDVARQGAVEGRRRHELHVLAQVVASRLAHGTASAGDSRLYGDAVSRLQLRNFCANLLDDSRSLVPEDQRCLYDEVADASVLPVVDVRPADTDRPDADQDLSRARLGPGPVLDPQVSDSGEDCRRVRRVGRGHRWHSRGRLGGLEGGADYIDGAAVCLDAAPVVRWAPAGERRSDGGRN